MAAAADSEQSEISFFSGLVYGPRDISGTVFVDRGNPATGSATADSLGLDTAQSFQWQLGAGYRRWRLAFNFLPTSFTGEGFADVDINIGNLPPIAAQTPVSSNIDVNLLLLDLSYDVFRSESWTAALGAGLGQTEIDLALVPSVGQPLAFDGNTPFGYIGGSLQWRFAYRWTARGAVQWISGAFDGADIDYGNYNAAISYRLTQQRWVTELVGGYRRVGFKFDYTVTGSRLETDFVIEGPYLGILLGW